MRYIVVCIFLVINLFSCKDVRGQTGRIPGSVTAAGTRLISASVTLLKGSDSVWILSELTDDKGAFLFRDLADGNYIVVATSLGYKTASQQITVTEKAADSCFLDLEKENTVLSEIAITTRKPFIEMSMGKLTVNIENSVNTGTTNVIELMRRLPGVTVDMNNNITMQGKAGVLVLIDDRQTYLTGDDLAEYLKTLTADEVSQIELITKPGAKELLRNNIYN